MENKTDSLSNSARGQENQMKQQDNQEVLENQLDTNAVEALSEELTDAVAQESGVEELFDEKKEELEEGVLAKAAEEGVEVASSDSGAIDVEALAEEAQSESGSVTGGGAGGGMSTNTIGVLGGLGAAALVGVALSGSDGSSGGGAAEEPNPNDFPSDGLSRNATVSSPSVAEGDNGTTVLTFTITLDRAPRSEIALSAAVTGGTANGDDIVVASNKVTFATGQTSATFTVIVNGDTAVEVDETVEVTLTGGGLPDPVVATGTIENDDSSIVDPGPSTPDIFTLKENVVTTVIPGEEGTDGVVATKSVTYWGYNPHAHGETDVDNLDGNDPTGNDNNLTNEGPADGGVPVSEFLAYFWALAAEDGGVNDLLAKFEDIGIPVDDVNINQDTPDFSSVQSLNVTADDDVTVEGVTTYTLEIGFENDAGEFATAEVALGELYSNLISDLIFDEEGNSRLFEVEVPVTTWAKDDDLNNDGFGDLTGSLVADITVGNVTYEDIIIEGFDENDDPIPVLVPAIVGATAGTDDVELVTELPIILTTTQNNGGTEESGLTSGADNLIVAGRLDLLHGAYIDAGEGNNTLEIDTKGYFAQPKALLNIQTINVNNLPNIYTTDSTVEGGSTADPDVGNTYPDLSGDGIEYSIIDLSRAVDLTALNISSGDFENLDVYNNDAGELTLTGIRNGATVTLDGYFGADLNLNYGLAQGDGLSLVLNNVNFVDADLNIAHNSPTLNITSTGGGNVLEDSGLYLNANLMNLNIDGAAKLYISDSLADAFAEGTPAVIDASANTGGVDLNMNGFADELVFTGTEEADDHLTATGGARNATITGGNGNNEFIIGTSEDITITVGSGNNELQATTDGDITITAGDGDNEVSATSTGGDSNELEDSVVVTVGGGDNNISVSSTDDFSVTAGNGNNVIDASSGSYGRYDVTENDVGSIVVGDGNNQIDFSGGTVNITAGDGANQMTGSAANLTIDAGNGGNTITSLNNDTVSITSGEGNDSVTVSGASITVNLDKGDDTLAIAGTSGTSVNSSVGAPNLVLVLDGSGSMGFGPGSNLQAQTDAVHTLLDTLPDDASVYVVWSYQGGGFWGSKADAAQIADDLAAGTISGTWDTTTFVNEVQDALTNTGGTYNNGGANEVIYITDGANSGLASEQDYIDFLVDNDAVANAIGIGVSGQSATDVVDSFAYDGRADSDLDALIAPTNAELADLLDALGQNIVTANGNNGAEVVINLGEGENTLILGDSDKLAQGFVALEGSSITGSDITMIVNTNSDLRAAELTGISRVILDNDDVGSADKDVVNGKLVLTDEQFMAIGAENFSVEGSIFYTYSQLEIIITGDRSLTELGADALARNIDLVLLVEDGATLSMTAEQLHTKVAPEGVKLVNDGNTDVINGKVVITGAGEDFDPFNTNDTVRTNIDGTIYYGGSLSSDFMVNGTFYNVEFSGETVFDEDGNEIDGYDRPADEDVIILHKIDTGTGNNVVRDDGIETWKENLVIIGERDIEFTGLIKLAQNQGLPAGPFVIDFAGLDGEVINMTVDHFEYLGQGGGIYGNSSATVDAEVLIHLAADVSGDGIGFDEDDAQALVSQGVARYIVTQIDGDRPSAGTGSEATIKLCDTVEDLQVIGLRGNENDTLVVVDAAWAHAFELQGEVLLKRDQDGNLNSVATVGAIDANFEYFGGIAFVNLVHADDNDDSPIEAAGVSVANAAAMVINAEGPSALLADLNLTEGLTDLTLNADGDLYVSIDEDPAALDTMDASGVAGDFVIELNSEDNDLTDVEVTDLDGVVLLDGADLVLTVDQALDIGLENIDADDNGGSYINLMGLAGQEVIISQLDEDFEDVDAFIAEGQDVTLAAATDLTGLDTLTVGESSSVTMSADQFLQLYLSGSSVEGMGSVAITGLMQAHIDMMGALDLSLIDVDGDITVTLAEDVTVPASSDNDLNGASFEIGGFTFTLPEVQLVDGLTINGGAGSVLAFTDLVSGAFEENDASGFNVEQLYMQALLVQDRNIDLLFSGLPESVEKVINDELSFITPVDQTVTIQATTTVPGFLVFNPPNDNVELEDFTLNMEGGAVVEGNIRLSTQVNEDGLINLYLKTVTINSTGTEANTLSGEEANVIFGDLTSQGFGGISEDNNLLDVTINAEQDFVLLGSVIFESITDANNPANADGVASNDIDDAIAVLNINGSADVNLGGLDTSDLDVDGLIVNNNGTGTATLGVDGTAIQIGDVFSFLGGSISLVITDGVDFTDGDDLSAVTSIYLNDGATLSLTVAQSDAIGPGNIFLAEGASSAMLNLEGLGEEPFALANFNDGIVVDLLEVISSQAVVTLHPDTDLTGINGLVVPEGVVLNLTAAQFQQLGNGSITGVESDGVTATTNFTVNITDLMQADVDFGFDLSGVTADNLTVGLAENVNIPAPDGGDIDPSDLNGADINIGAFIFALYEIQLADGLAITGEAGSVLEFTDLVSGAFESIDASGFNVERLLVQNLLVADRNFDLLFSGLPEAVIKSIDDDLSIIELVDQTVEVTAGTTVPGFLVFNPPENPLENFTLNLLGGTYIGGGIRLSNQTDTVDNTNQILRYLETVTINSTGTEANSLSGVEANIIDGNLTSLGYFGISEDNNLLNVTINADQAFTLTGFINFESVTDADDGTDGDANIGDGADGVTANDNESAIAQLNVTGTADVSLGGIDTTDIDVDGIVVNNSGTGILSLNLLASQIDQDAGNDNVDSLSFTGGNIHLTTFGMIDLSDDDTSGLSQLTIGEDSTLILSQAQFDALGAANLLNGDTDDVMDEVLHLVDVGNNFDATSVADGIIIGSLTFTGGNIVLDPAANLTGVLKLVVPEGSTLSLTAAQFQQLQGVGTIEILDTDGNVANDTLTVNITDLTQADVDYDVDNSAGETDGFNLTGIADAATVNLSLFEDVNLAVNTMLDDLTRLAVTLADGQTLGLDNSTQADGLVVNGGVDSTLMFLFNSLGLDSFPASGNQVDASNYDVTTLRALNTFIDGEDIENILIDLASSVTLQIYQSFSDMGVVAPTDRVVVIEESVTVPGFVVVNDWDNNEAVRTLHLTLSGGSEIDGNLRLTTVAADPALIPQWFQGLTIVSEGVAANSNTGSTDNVIDGDISAMPVFGGTPIENNLLSILFEATQNMVVTGDLVLSSIDEDDFPSATVTQTGTADVTVQQIVTDSEISTLTLDNQGTGTFTATGASPGVMGDPALENLIILGTGDIILGSNPDVATEWGITASGLSNIDASGHSGMLDLGEVKDIDSADFSFTSGTGITHLNLTTDTLNADADGADNIAGNGDDEPGWSFDFTGAAAGSYFELGNVNWTMGDLNIDLGANTTLYITADTDWRNIDLNLTQTQDIVLAAGVELKLNADQAHMLNIVPEAGIITNSADPAYVAADVPVVNIYDPQDNKDYDFSGIAQTIAGTIQLVTDSDVTAGALADLGFFSVSLVPVTASDVLLSGQTFRFQTETQAARDVLILDGLDGNVWDSSGLAGSDDNNFTNSTNIVWLFDSVSGPVNTDGYSSDLGRLWITPDLANGNNEEQLFTTLPDTILRVEFSSLTELDILLSSDAVDRIVELVAFTDLPLGMTFNDEDRLEHVQSLTLKAGGSVNGGPITIDNIVDPAQGVDTAGIVFDSITIESHRALSDSHFLAPENFVNDNDGNSESGEHVQPANVNTFGDIGVGSAAPGPGLDLLEVNLNTLTLSTDDEGNGLVAGAATDLGANLVVGTITYDAEAGNTAPAVLNVMGANTTTVASLNTGDADIASLVVTNSGPGTLLVTGASPAGAVSNTESFTTNATGDVEYGTAGDADKPGVAGADLTTLDVNGTGDVNFNTIALVDGAAPVLPFIYSFMLDATDNSGIVSAVMDAATVGTPELQAGGVWVFDNGASGELNVTMTDAVILGAGSLYLDNMTLTIDGNVDFTGLVDFAYNIDNGASTIVVPAGSSLTLTAEQADGITITGGGLVTVTELEATPGADLSGIMTNEGDSGTVEATVDTSDGPDADALPEAIDLSGDLGIAHVTISGDGSVSISGGMDATIDRDPTAAVNNEFVMATFTVEAAATLNLTAEQGDDRSVDGAGTTNVADLGIYVDGTPDQIDLSGVASGQVNIAVDSDVTLNSDSDLGAAGPTRVTTIGAGATLTAAGSVVTGQYITGENGTLLVDDENDNGNDNIAPADTPITADLSNVSAEFITLVDTAEVGTITFPVLYGDPAAYDLDNTVPFQTVTLTARQATGQTITGANAGAEGQVIVNDLDGDNAYNLSLIDVGRPLAHVIDTPVVLDGATNLGEFSVLLDAVAADFTLSAAQADGRSITDGNAVDDATVTVTALEATPNADLSMIVANTEFALLDANGGVTLGANLGSNMEVIVSDSVAGGPNVVTFTGMMVSGATTFTIASDDIGLVFDANDAHQLTVGENPAVANSAVTVNNVDGDEMDLSNIVADSLVANVPADATLHALSDLGDFVVVLAEAADLTMNFDQFKQVGLNVALEAGDFASAAGGVEELVTVTDFDPAFTIDSSVVLPELALVLMIDDALGANQTIAAGSNLLGVEEIVIPAGVTLNMTADQYQQIQTSVTVSGAGTLNLTNFDNDNADIDLSNVTANAGRIFLDPAAGATAVVGGELTGTPIIVDPTAVLDNQAGDQFFIVFTADDQGITLSSETQADGRSVIEDGLGFADTRLILGFDTADATDADANIESGNYGPDHLYIINEYLNNEFGGVTPANIETMLTNLDGAIDVTVFDADTALVTGLVTPTAVASHDRFITIEPNTYVDASVAFNDIQPDSEVRNITLNLGGNSVIDGSLLIPQSTDPQTGLPNTYVQLFDTLTINSTNETGGALVSPNRIIGQVVANDGVGGAESRVETFVLTLDAAMMISGSQEQIFFNGRAVGLNDGDDVDDVGAALAATTYQNWSASYNAATNEVTFTNITAGDVADVSLADFTFVQNDAGTVGFPGASAVATTQQGVFEANENNLLHVVIDATYDLTITGVLEFSYVEGSSSIVSGVADLTAEALLEVDVDPGVTVNIGSVNTADDHIIGLTYLKTGAGTVNAPGTSPGASIGDTEYFNIGTVADPHEGTSIFGTAGDITKPGVGGDDLSDITVVGAGTVDLGVIALVDETDFTLDTTAFDGDLSAELRADQTGGDWLFDNTGSAGNLNLTIYGTGAADSYPADEATDYGAAFSGGGNLTLNNVNLTISGTVDFFDVNLVLGAGTTIAVAAGSTLILTVDQAQAFDDAMISITGEGTIEIVGEWGDNDIGRPLGEYLNTVTVDFTAVTVVETATNTEINLFGADADSNGAFDSVQTVIGSNANDAIVIDQSAPQPYSISALDGDDTVTGAISTDTIDGGAGNNTLVIVNTATTNYNPVDGNLENIQNVIVDIGNAISTEVNLSAQAGEAFNVTLSNAGDTVTTADGDDTITGGTGADSVNAGAGTDSIVSGGGADTLRGGIGEDTITGVDANAVIDGDDATSTVPGDGVADVLVIEADTFNDTTDDQIINIEIVNAMPADSVTGANISLDAQTEGFLINGSDDDADTNTAAVGADTITAGAGADTVNAGSGDDVVAGGAGDNILNGEDGDDSVTGGADVDSISGGAGNDTLTGGAGADSIYGGDNDDRLVFADAAELAGDATVDGGAGTDTVEVLGTTLVDADFTNFINVEEMLFSADAAHSITLGAETDEAFANGIVITAPNNTGANALTVDGTLSTVSVDATGTAAADTLTGGTVGDTLTGAGGADVIDGQGGDDALDGGADNDSLTGGAGVDTLVGGLGDDTLVGDSDDALLDGDDDTTPGGSLVDVLELGANFNDASDAQIVNLEIVNLTNNTGTNVNLADQTEGFTINGTDSTTVVGENGQDTITGGQGADSITGGTGNDILDGQDGDDTLLGGDDDDTLIGGSGNDTLTGGDGVDTFDFGADDGVAETDTITDWNNDELAGALGAGDQLNVVFSAFGGGIDNSTVQPVVAGGAGGADATVEFDAEYDAGDIVTVTIAGQQFVHIVAPGATQGFDIAQAAETFFRSNGGMDAADADLVNGAAGFVAETIGGLGAGRLRITNDNTGDGNIAVTASEVDANGILFDAFEDGVTGIAAVNGVLSVTGGDFDDTITAGNGNDTIAGGQGLDQIFGQGGNDSIDGGSGDDTLSGGSGADTLIGGTGNDELTGGAGVDLFDTGRFTTGVDHITDFDAASEQLLHDLNTAGFTLWTTGGGTVGVHTGTLLAGELFTATNFAALSASWKAVAGATNHTFLGFTTATGKLWLGYGNSAAITTAVTMATVSVVNGVFDAGDVVIY
jgi:Ca2+-binding RTX toxin-like protein